MINKNDAVILLTACINPNGMDYTVVQDPIIRRKQYCEALNYYLTKHDFKIVFVENSLYDMSLLYSDEISKGSMEYLTFDGNRYNKELGKGYGEAKIIEYAFKNSEFIKQATCVIKITGRIIVKNLNTLWSLIRNKVDNRQDFVALSLYRDLIFADSQIFFANHSFYLKFLAHKDEINDSKNVFFEHILVSVLKAMLKNNLKVIDFPVAVRLDGFAGSTGIKYSSSIKSYFINSLKKILKHIIIIHKLKKY